MGFIQGEFNNLAQGQKIGLTYGGLTYEFIANYYGGSGNDLVLQWAYRDAYCWGRSIYGQLGNNSGIDSKVPVAVANTGVLAGKTVLAVAAGASHSLALCSDGTVAAWGYNSSGQLGNNSTTNSSVPVVVTRGVLAGKTVVAVAAGGGHNLALCSDGTVAAWGSNGAGQLGNNSTTNSSVPVAVTRGVLAGKTVVEVAAGGSHSLALCSDGTVAAWGGNSFGQLGNGSTIQSSVPVAVGNWGVLAGKTVVAVAAGQVHNLALCSDGTVAAWGYNSSGQLGNNSTTDSIVPVVVTTTGLLAGKTVVAVAAGTYHNLALCADGTVAGWGYNANGQLGNGSTTNSSVPVAVTPTGSLAGKSVVAVVGGGSHSLVIAASPLSADTTLSSLTLDSSPLNPVLAPKTATYSASVSNSTTSVTVTPTVTNPFATMKVNGITASSGSASGAIALAVGNNRITVVVTAQNGIDSSAYTIDVLRTSDLNFTYTAADQAAITFPAYAATGNTVNLSLGFAPQTGTDLTVVKNTGIGFIGGKFNNLAQGQKIELTYGGLIYEFIANYYGGSGNDLVLQWAHRDVYALGQNPYGPLDYDSTTDSSVLVAVANTGVLAGKTVVAVAAGAYHNLALCSDGTVAGWGYNYYGQLGNNSTTDSSVPVAVANTGVLAGKTVVAVETGLFHSLALCSDGTVAAWGSNSAGRLGNNSTTDSSVPVAVTQSGVLAGKTVVAVAAGGDHNLALCSDGTVAAWGVNGSGQLGNNSTTDSSVPVAVANTGVLAGKTVVAVAAGGSRSAWAAGYGHNLALCSDGTVAAWGYNDSGQLGNNSMTNSSVPVVVTTTGVLAGKTVVAVAAGALHSLALCADGAVAAWGYNGYGQLGNGSMTESSVPVAVANTGVLARKTVVAVAAGDSHNLALCSDGMVAAWGVKADGSVPVAVANTGGLAGKTVVAVAAGVYHSLAIVASSPTASTLSSLTLNSSALYPDFASTVAYSASVPNSTTSVVVTPTVTNPLATVKVNGTTVSSGSASGAIALAVGSNRISVVVTAQNGIDSSAYTIDVLRTSDLNFTYTASDQTAVTFPGGYAANGSAVNLSLGFAPQTGTDLMLIKNTGLNFISERFNNLAQGQKIGLTYGGITYGFIADYYGGSGNDLVLRWAYRDAYAWGYNYYGQLGNNSTTDSSVPVAVANTVLAGKTVLAVAAGGDHNLALCSDRTVAAWGSNSNGQLGNGSTTASSVPVAVTITGVLAGKTVLAVAAGMDHSLALCSDGTVAAWGDNYYGQLGNNSTTNSSVPVTVTITGVLAGKTVVAVAAGLYHSLALCSDGTVAAWGYNANGELGNGSTTNSSVPVAVAYTGVLAGKTVVAVAAGIGYSLALCSDGTVAAWGGNGIGALGNGSTTASSVPVAVTTTGVLAGKTVVAVAAGNGHSLALCSDGTLAAWGSNLFGTLGNNSTTDSSVPVAVTTTGVLAGKTVVAVAAGLYHSLALCSDGTVAGWGYNDEGELGNNSTTNSSVPVAVANTGVLAGKTVVAVAAGYSHSLAIAVSPLSVDSTLSSLTLDSSALYPAFAPTTAGYSASVPNSTTSVAVTPTVTNSYASVKVNGTTVSSGSSSAAIPLTVGNNTITVMVTAQDDKATSSYTVTVMRAPSSVSTLAVLALSSGTLSPSFSTRTIAYTASVLSSVKSLQVTPSVTDSTASVKINGVAVTSGSASSPISLTVGNNPIQVVATAQDGSTISSYTVTVFLPSAVATLSGLTCSSGSLSPAFSSGTAAYAVSVANDCTGVTLTPTVTEPNATVRVNGTLLSSGTVSAKIPVVASGSNVINVAVMAQDGVMIQTYAVTVTRPALNATFASVATLPLSVASYDASGNFANLSLGYAPTAGTTLTLVKVTGLGFIQGRFSNLAQGQLVSMTYQGEVYPFVVNYYGGTGNDLVLQWANDKTYAWGANSYGQLGNNGTSNSSLPTSVLSSGALSGKSVVAVAAGSFHSLALCADGTLAAWGRNDFGQLGNNSTTQSNVPINITNSGVLSGKTVVAISAGYYHNLALCSDGTVAAWGQNTYGQLGDGTNTNSSVPMAVTTAGGLSGKSVSGIAAGYYHNLAQCTDGSLVAWGRNTYGQLGNNSTTDSSVPVDISRSGVLSGRAVTQFAAGSDHSLVMCSDGSLATWGRNNYGQLGEGSGANSAVPVEVDSTDALAGKVVTSISAGGWHNLALCSDGTLAGFGRNLSGQLGDGGTTNSGLPITANLSGLGGKAIAAVQAANGHSLALCADGSIYAWGSSSNGQLGNGGTTNSSLPVAVTSSPLGSGERFMTLATGTSASHSMALVATLPTNTGFSAWAASHAGLSDSTALGDPDKDGISNVLEYVLNGNPAVASAAVLPVVSQNASSFLFSFSRAVASAADTTQVFQYSTDLSHWTEVSLTPPTDPKVTLGAEDGAGIQPVTVTIPKAANSAMFGRLKVTQP